MKGLHLTADLYRCRCEPAWLADAALLQAWCLASVEAVGLATVDHAFRALPAPPQGRGGLSATVLMADGHVCLHTWPGEKAVSADVYVGSANAEQTAKARGLMFALVNRFQPEWTEQRSLDRGEEE
ncbi:S-adenosylmethionine decarboxylase [Ramlibacter sp.]|uniref:S-adenosylmethionine decarboxylase family protein n=1 Tax=Ramlibacter sp. TaxID=1917967 RepID=UPI00262A87C2|nr:S-adenosylmethionine decarboxylase [Ramlibacter sp.]MDB5954934.1 speD [Ramlibacter sp.]